MKEISVDTLRDWLEQGRPVSVLDVRPESERREWWIPGSVHEDAYERLKAGDPGALAGFEPPPGRPVVTVCGAGKTSRIAAEQLGLRGIEVFSLQGGMKAWSLAWNTAEVAVPGEGFRVLQIRRTGKGCLSYLIDSAGEALVIDASLAPEVYLDLARSRGSRIRRVVETHVHADHLSRARQLAGSTGAELLLPEQRRVSFPHVPIRDGDTLRVGEITITALRTPGHTMESTCYLLARGALFTGDTLFLGSVGRPDLHAGADEARERAHLLYHSLRRLFELPPAMLVLPGHVSEPAPFDGRPITATLDEVARRTGVLRLSADEFVAFVLARIPPAPPNYQRIVGHNESGNLPDGDPAELEAGANRCAVA